jgi:hypothetical protein
VNRRGFLAALAGAFVADPERALWVPGQKLISIPSPIRPIYSRINTTMVESGGVLTREIFERFIQQLKTARWQPPF